MSLISMRYILSHCSVCQMPQYRKRKAYCDQNPQRIQAQKLFLIAEDPIEDQPLKVVQLTASQAVASRYMDSDYLV
ncbi:hypothetical protein WIL86_15925, partial [Vibrio cholerae]